MVGRSLDRRGEHGITTKDVTTRTDIRRMHCLTMRLIPKNTSVELLKESYLLILFPKKGRSISTPTKQPYFPTCS